MSSGLFRSKQFKSKKSLKKLSISAPLSNASIGSPTLESASAFAATHSPASPAATSSPDPVVVLRAKYDFNAESPNELSVRANEYLKLIHRPGNGWISVQYLDKINQSGLIPASYVDIAVNDSVNPISYDWLNQIRDQIPTADFGDDESQTSDDDEAVELDDPSAGSPRRVSLYHNLDFDNISCNAPNLNIGTPSFTTPYPKSVSIVNVLQNCHSRVWYRVDFKMSDDTTIYIGKYYQDFYNLHINLSLLEDGQVVSSLPKLPAPMRTQSSSSSLTHTRAKSCDNLSSSFNNRLSDKKYLESLLNRCNELNSYFNKLLHIDAVQHCLEISNFIESNDIRVVKHKDEPINNRQINNTLYEDSIDLADLLQPKTIPRSPTSLNSFSPTAPLPPVDGGNYKLSSKVDSHKSSSNMKYSSYMNQSPSRSGSGPSSPLSGDASSPKQQTRRGMTKSTSSNTISSYTSLIDDYDDEEEKSEEGEDAGFDSPRHSLNDTEETSASDDGSSIEQHIAKIDLNKKHSTISFASNHSSHNFKGHYSSDVDSVFSRHHQSPSQQSPQQHQPQYQSHHSYQGHHNHLHRHSYSIYSTSAHRNSQPATPTFSQNFEDQVSPLTPSTPILEDDHEFELSNPKNRFVYSPSMVSSSSSPYKVHRRNLLSISNRSSTYTPPLYDNIKIKIMLNNAEKDIVALKMKQTNLISIVYLKKLLSFKIYKDANLINHYKLVVIDSSNTEGGELNLSDDDLLNYIKSKSKVTLKLVRSRN